MEETHRQAPKMPVAYLVMNLSGVETNLEKLTFKPTIYSPYYKMLDEEAVKICHDKNIKVIPWTVNNGDSARELIAMGVDGIITDYPNMAKK
ncbi:MAG: glycerophosphodiester phosphodiesterase family protein [Bacteroidota bacterium]